MGIWVQRGPEEISMTKLTILYGHPTDVDAFEDYYLGTHMPIAGKMNGVDRLELTRFGAGPDGSAPAYHRMAEIYFSDAKQMQETLGSAEGQAAVADLPNFASGGVTMLAGAVHN